VTPKKVIDYHLARLKDKNPDIRLKAIQELELIGATETLKALRDVFENDEDSAVRKAAQAAGRAIFLKQQNAGDEAE
jgi:HEAT repeat protein